MIERHVLLLSHHMQTMRFAAGPSSWTLREIETGSAVSCLPFDLSRRIACPPQCREFQGFPPPPPPPSFLPFPLFLPSRSPFCYALREANRLQQLGQTVMHSFSILFDAAVTLLLLYLFPRFFDRRSFILSKTKIHFYS